jgi:hypothetical protein
MWSKIKNFFKRLFIRQERVEIAVSIAKGLKAFADSSADDILFYVFNILSPATGTVMAFAKNFLNSDLPTLLKALELIDASDETAIRETNINAVVSQVKQFGSIVDQTALTTAIEKSFKDGKITLGEAKDILSNYLK